jgi:ketosteroid isomerase-like protein
MKRIVSATWMALAALTLVTLCLPARAQDPAREAMTNDVRALLSRFVAALNSGNLNEATTMISTKPSVSIISNGRITRGPNAIAGKLNELMGLQGKYQFKLGVLDVANVNGVALVTGPYTVSVKGRSGSASGRGAVTFLLENQARRRWVIVHINRCLREGEVTTQ